MGEEHPPYHSVTSIDFGVTRNSSLTVMCNGVRFHITIYPENLEHCSSLETEYRQLLNGLQDPEDQTGSNVELFEDWVLEPCLPQFKELAPVRRFSRPMTLEEYFDPVTFILILKNVNNNLVAECCPYDPTITAHLAPQISLSDIPGHMDIPRIKASKIEIVPGPDPMEDATSDPPKRVRIPDGTKLFFKAALENDSFWRELGMLFRFARAGLSLRVPKVFYIVESSNRNSVIGMLMNHIDYNGRTLRAALPGSSAPTRKKWMGQVKDIVNQLHGMGEVWGDVKPDNILIDGGEDAWVIDFGGGYSPDWIDHEKRDTMEGDVQGVSRLQTFLGID